MAALRWTRLRLAAAGELRLHATFANGQCFGWKPIAEPDGSAIWVGVLKDSVVALREQGDDVEAAHVSGGAVTHTMQSVRDLLQLDTPLLPLVKRWGSADPTCRAIACRVPGMRVLRQDPLECLISFICSSNNNIKRITKVHCIY